ncbi:tRNA (adenosine(37)-N6)-threonylcarbamoyltransferase complex transferase subunit TsaD [bacterium]|nr:tRNA (adenosine(37)-N6)-threonylcarbamoyltransferase complex transferase subunit TsaD [bacterium]
MALILGIETTCDETAAAVFSDEAHILSSVVATQAELHVRYGGVVPEIASRAHVERILPVIDEALTKANVRMADLSAVAVAYTPGLVGSILVGLAAAKAICVAQEIPLLGVNHLEGHIYACQMIHPEPVFPCIGMVVSGGHTNLFHCLSATELELIGSTIDDAAGEAFDKVASILKLPYPGGPNIERLARSGDPKAHDFPRSLMEDGNLDFSFSGLKTAVLYKAYGQNTRRSDRELPDNEVADLAASFQHAVIRVLVEKARRALRQFDVKVLCVGGGVAANGAFRSALEEMAKREKITLVIPPLALCTDNAAMGAVAVEKFRRGEFDSLDLDAAGGLLRRH